MVWLLCTIPLAIISRVLLLFAGDTAAYFTPCRIDEIGMGSLLAVYVTNQNMASTIARRMLLPLYFICPMLITCLFVFTGTHLFFIQATKSTIVGSIYTALLVFILSARPDQWLYTLFASRVLVRIGKYSYGMYVLHMMAVAFYSRISQFFWQPVGLIVCITFTFLFAATSWHLFERPFLELKRHFVA